MPAFNVISHNLLSSKDTVINTWSSKFIPIFMKTFTKRKSTLESELVPVTDDYTGIYMKWIC